MAPRRKKTTAKKKQNKAIEEEVNIAEEIPQPKNAGEKVTNRERRMFQSPAAQSVVEDDSVIMLSSAENTLVTVDDSSLMMLTAGAILRPSTRLSNIDMTLEETVESTSRQSAKSFGPEDTNMSIINIIQTPGVHRDRPKSSVAIRRTGGSMAGGERDSLARPIRNRSMNRNIFSGDFVMVTKRRNKVVSRSTRHAEQELETVRENSAIEDPETRTQEIDLNKTPIDNENVVPSNHIETRSTAKKKETAPSVRTRSSSRDKTLRTPNINVRTRASSAVKSRTATTGKRQNATKQSLKESTEKSTKNKRNVKPKTRSKNILESDKSLEPLPNIDTVSTEETSNDESQRQKRNSEQLEIDSNVPLDTAKVIDDEPSSLEKQSSDQQNASDDANKQSPNVTQEKPTKNERTARSKTQTKKQSKTISSAASKIASTVLSEEIMNVTTEHHKNDSKLSVDIAKVIDEESTGLDKLDSDKQTADDSVLKTPGTNQFSNISTRRRPKLWHNKENDTQKGFVSAAIRKPLEDIQNKLVSDRTSINRLDLRKTLQSESFRKTTEENLFKSPTVDVFSHVSKRRRPKPGHDHSQNTSSSSTASSETMPEKRPRTESVPSESFSNSDKSRNRSQFVSPVSQNLSSKEENVSPKAHSDNPKNSESTPEATAPTSRYRTRSASRGRTALAPKQPKCPCCINSLVKHSPKANAVPVPESRVARGRPRTRRNIEAEQRHNRSRNDAVNRTEPTDTNVEPSRSNRKDKQSNSEAGKPSSRARSKSVLRNAKEISTKNITTPRSSSVPRGVLLSPGIQRQDNCIAVDESSSHVPIYRRYAEDVALTRSVSVASLTALPPPEPIPADGDIYAFDSPSQTPVAAMVGTGKKASTVSKKPRMPRKKKATPAKKASHCVFGTDMGRIREVVRKIGGGPVRQHPDGKDTMVDTAIVEFSEQPLNPQMVQIQHRNSRDVSPVSNYDDHHNNYDDFENIPTGREPPSAPVSARKHAPPIRRVLQEKSLAVSTPDQTQPNVTMNFSPLGASSPWRVQNENILPKTFYFSRSKDLLPSYESDIVIRHADNRPKSPARGLIELVADPAAPPRKTSPTHSSMPRPTHAVGLSPSKSAAMFQDIQKSYEQLKVTSEMSEKLISAMRKYKSNTQNHNSLFSKGPDGLSEDERLIAKFREYETNMKKTYLKLKQWYERSQRVLKQSIQAIETVSTLPKTSAQKEVLQNFHRHSEQFVTMINELECAMNDSNVENVAPPKSGGTKDPHVFKEIILSERDFNNPNRSPLKSLDIISMPPNHSPVKSPLVKASYSAFSSNNSNKNSLTKSRDRFSKLSLVKHQSFHPAPTQSLAGPSVLDIGNQIEPTTNANCSLVSTTSLAGPNETQPNKDLFGFEEDVNEDFFTEPTAVNITKDTLKVRLQSARKMLPARPPSRSRRGPTTRGVSRIPKIIGSPTKLRSIHSALSSSTPVANNRKQTKQVVEPEPEPNVSAIVDDREPPKGKESPPVVLFAEPEVPSMSQSCVNRTYSRIPKRNLRRKQNIYLAGLGLSDDDDDDVEVEIDSDASTAADKDESSEAVPRKRQKKHTTGSKAKKTVEQTEEFKKFVDDFNSMCEEVNRYPLIVEHSKQRV
ncbi:uncharacterized protein LOC131438507 [Malaya genurostris]|uniref:uncharacterized protein LOC131438507 n=1 Tax=Malaya genurostris TaxID=325434 RepID=UPI0026F39E43|nr:uncharacterized protein LOC131438507 [Malaya genurostris]